MTCRIDGESKIHNQHGKKVDTYNFTRVYGAEHSTNDLFETAMKPLMDFKILQGINSIFIVYGQSGSGKSFTLIGEPGHLGLFPMSLQYLLDQESVQQIDIMSIECYGIKAAKIGFYDLVHQLKEKEKLGKKYDAYATKDNSRLTPKNAEMINVTKDNCLSVITNLQEVSHMAPTLKNPHSSRGHTCYFTRIKIKGLEDVYFIAIDLAGSEGQTALGTKDEFTEGLKLAMSKGKLHLNKKQMKGIEEMYKTRSLEAGCINNGLTQLQSIFGELIKKKISKSQGLGLRKVLSSFISLNSAYAILFTLSASANNNKVTRATLNFAKQTQLVKVDTKKAAAKIDKDAIIKELNALIEELRKEMSSKDAEIKELKQTQSLPHSDNEHMSVFDKFDELNAKISEAKEEEKKWSVNVEHVHSGKMSESEMKEVFDEFDEDGGGSIDAGELQHAMKKMGQTLSMEEVNDLIEDIDENGDGEVDFDEFKVMATKGWFVNAFESKLVESLQKSMALYMTEDEDEDDNDSKHDDHEHEDAVVVTQEMLANANENESSEQPQRIAELENEIKALKEENEKRQNEEIERLQNEMKELMNEHMEQNKVYEKQIEELKEKLSSIQTENDELKESVDTFAKQKSEMTSLHVQQIEELQSKLSQNEETKDLEAKLKKYETKNDELLKENEELKRNVDSLTAQKSDITTLQKQNLQEIEMMKAKLSENAEAKKLESEMKESEVKSNKLLKENSALKQKLRSLQDENDKLKAARIENAKDSQMKPDVKKLGIRNGANNDVDIANIQQPPNSVVYELMRKVLEGLV